MWTQCARLSLQSRDSIKTRFQSVAVADQLSMLEDRLLVTLGARYQSLKDYAYDYESGARLESSYDEDAVTLSVFHLRRREEVLTKSGRRNG